MIWPFVAVELGDLAELEVDLPVHHQFLHLVDRGRRRLEGVAAVHERQRCARSAAGSSVQSSAESPPPTMTTSWPRKSSILRTE